MSNAIRRAVVDIGTNSVKLLVADVDGSTVIPLVEDSEQTRLGRGFYDTHRLAAEAIADTARAVANFIHDGKKAGARTFRVIATSAARDAVNQQELLDAVSSASGVAVEVISGSQEAELAYRGVRSDPRMQNQRLLILDVGGGSSEFIVGEDFHPEFSHSFPLGSVRLMEKLRPSDPPLPAEMAGCRAWLREFFASNVHPLLDAPLAADRARTRLIGTGGAASILARMEFKLDKFNRDRIEDGPISVASVQNWMEKLWAMPLRERQHLVGLPKKRADVILTGMAIYEAVLNEFGFAEVWASTRGLRFAAVAEAP